MKKGLTSLGFGSGLRLFDLQDRNSTCRGFSRDKIGLGVLTEHVVAPKTDIGQVTKLPATVAIPIGGLAQCRINRLDSESDVVNSSSWSAGL